MKLASLPLLILISAPSFAQVPTAGAMRAQADMHTRVDNAVHAYARKIEMDSAYVSYCRSQMHLDTRHEIDGFIPFGVNYLELKDTKQLEEIISAREAYERSYLILCLARAKAVLREAERR